MKTAFFSIILFLIYTSSSAQDIIYSNPVIEKAFVNFFGHDYDFSTLNLSMEKSFRPKDRQLRLGNTNTLLIYTVEDKWAEAYESGFKLALKDNRNSTNIWTSPEKLFDAVKLLNDTIAKIYPDRLKYTNERLATWESRLNTLESQLKTTLRPIRKVPFAEYGNSLETFALTQGLKRRESFKSWLQNGGEISSESLDSLLISMDSGKKVKDENLLRYFNDYTKMLESSGIGVMIFTDESYTDDMKLIAAKNKVRLAKINLLPTEFARLSYEQIILELAKSLKTVL